MPGLRSVVGNFEVPLKRDVRGGSHLEFMRPQRMNRPHQNTVCEICATVCQVRGKAPA